ncbi:hypothetical protein RIF29_14993 [Crotalaria pallida]|uniref:non-specific serine/threonine protein kinase n=1 Tax=Crotalaria pallida TaxID=3830 RepID=A0AAN9IIV2_CROPI
MSNIHQLLSYINFVSHIGGLPRRGRSRGSRVQNYQESTDSELDIFDNPSNVLEVDPGLEEMQGTVKRLYNQHTHNLKEFETKLETVGSIRHRNLVSLHGYVFTPYGNLLFYDYMPNGSLWDLLHGSSKVKLDWETHLRIVVGAPERLAYLHHDCNPRIVHRDVKSSNILLDENFEAHLSDFGTAKCISAARTHTSTYVLGI